METTPNDSDHCRRPSTAQVLVGLLIVGQIIFLVAGNLLPLLQDKDKQLPSSVKRTLEQLAPGWTKQAGPVWDISENTGKFATLWSGLTGQGQSWHLFSTVYRTIPFPAVEFRWEKPMQKKKAMPRAPEILLSDNEPKNIKRFFRLGQFRIRRVEGLFDLDASPGTDENAKDRVRAERQEFVSSYWDRIHVYLQWRARVFRQRNPNLPKPNQVILLIRTYRILPHGESNAIWSGPQTHTIARWLPQAAENKLYTPIDAYDPVEKKFRRVLR